MRAVAHRSNRAPLSLMLTDIHGRFADFESQG